MIEHPGQFLATMLKEKGWTQAQAALVIGKPKQHINDIVLGKRGITAETAQLLAKAFGTEIGLWMTLQHQYDSLGLDGSDSAVERRAEIYTRYPIRDMIKRGWISKEPATLEYELSRFFERGDFPYHARKVNDQSKGVLQNAWLHRTYQLAKNVAVAPYSQTKLTRAMDELRLLAISREEIVQVPRILADAGIRFLLNESIPASGIDGVCFWLDQKSPVVALSLRYDRVDNFWFTLMHELFHVRYEHGREMAMLDTDMDTNDYELSNEEREADFCAREFLVPKGELDSFIARVGPLYSSIRIQGFAKRIGVHPGIVVGQLHHRNAIEHSHHRKFLPKVRQLITSTALHDGWGMVT